MNVVDALPHQKKPGWDEPKYLWRTWNKGTERVFRDLFRSSCLRSSVTRIFLSFEVVEEVKD